MCDENIKIIITEKKESEIPKLIFIVPYRDREQHMLFFASHMEEVLSDFEKTDYSILYIHQCDKRPFNRGAMKNIGFLYVKNEYPNDYQNINLIFNDVDTMPFTKNFLNYETHDGNVKHYYGFDFTLGGIVSIKGGDFEKTNGFPNLWAWGYEDNEFQKRVIANGMHIDRSQYYPMFDKNILNIHGSNERLVNKLEYTKFTKNINDGFNTLQNVSYTFDEKTGFVNVDSFETIHKHDPTQDKIHDLKNGNVPYSRGYKNPTMKLSLL